MFYVNDNRTFENQLHAAGAIEQTAVSNQILIKIRPMILPLKTRCFGLHFYRRKFRVNHFYAMRLGSYQIRSNSAKQGPVLRSRSFKVTDFGTSLMLIYDFLTVINTNLPFTLHRFRYSFWQVKNRYITFKPPTEGLPWDDLRQIFRACQRMAKVPKWHRNMAPIAKNCNRLSIWCWVHCTNVTDRRKSTDRRQTDRL